MLPNLDPKTMARMMNQMGIKSTQVDSLRVIIEKSDGTKLVVTDPQVIRISMQGQDSFQVSGNVSEEAGSAGGASESESSSHQPTEDDIELVATQAKVSKQKAAEALQEAGGDIAEAILLLQDGGKKDEE